MEKMKKTGEYVRGSCDEMCPKQESKLRTKERLLHFYEWKSGHKNVPGILVKCFSRSAAGIETPKRETLRTERALVKSLEYLLKEIVLDKRRPFNFAYDFIFDRLRAIRQEIVMQNYGSRSTIKLLEPMIMFLAYSRYRLCEESINNFDPKICDEHLQECLKRVLVCYDEVYENAKKESARSNESPNRIFIESLYQLFNLGSIEALNRCIRLPKLIRSDKLFATVRSIAMNYFQGNFFKVLKGIAILPHILSAIVAIQLKTIRRKVLLIFFAAYKSKHLFVPVNWLQSLLLYNSSKALIEDCIRLKFQYNSELKAIRFFRADILAVEEAIQEGHEDFVEKKLKNVYLPDVLLLKELKDAESI